MEFNNNRKPIIIDLPTPEEQKDRIKNLRRGVEEKAPKEITDSPIEARIGGIHDRKDVFHSGRYDTFYRGLDMEDLYGRGQSSWQQIRRGVAKGALVAGTTFLEGTVGLAYGATSALSNGDLSLLFNNGFSRALDSVNQYVDDNYANYYTLRERNAKWYSTDSWLTGNFVGESLIKNTGFAVGAFYSGGVWTKGLSELYRGARGLMNVGKNVNSSGRLATLQNRAIQLNTELQSTTNPAQIRQLQTQIVKLGDEIGKLTRNTRVTNNIQRSLMATTSEAGIEARMAEQTTKDSLINDFTRVNGFAPNEEQLKEIEEISKKVSKSTFFSNVGLLSVTNMIQFPLLSGAYWKNLKRGATPKSQLQLGRVNIVDADGKVVSRGARRALREGESYIYSGASTRIGNQLTRTKAGKVLNRLNPVARSLFSGSQAFEAGSQVAFPNIWKEYYESGNEIGDSPFYNSFIDGMTQTFKEDKSGMLALLSGGLSGGMMRNITSPLTGGSFFDVYKRRGQLRKDTEEYVSNLNKNRLGEYIKELNISQKRTSSIESRVQDALQREDRLGFEDAKTDLEIAYLMPRIEYGKYEIVRDEINEYIEQAQTDEGFAQLQEQGVVDKQTTKEEYISNLLGLKSRAKRLNESFQSLSNQFRDIRNEDGTPKYSSQHIQKMAYLFAKTDDYNRRIPQLLETVNNNNINVSPLLEGVRSKDVTKEQLLELSQDVVQQIDQRERTMESMESEALKEVVSDLVELTSRQESAKQEYFLIKDSPRLFDEDGNYSPFLDVDGEGVRRRAFKVSNFVVQSDGKSVQNTETGEIRNIGEDTTLQQFLIDWASESTTNREETIQEVASFFGDTSVLPTIESVTSKILNDENLTPLEEQFYEDNLEIVERNALYQQEQAMSDKEAFYEGNKDTIFEMGDDKGKLTYDRQGDKLLLNNKEVSSNDFKNRNITSKEPINNPRDFINTEDSRNLTTEQLRLVEKARKLFTESVARRKEIESQVKEIENSLKQNTKELEKGDFNNKTKERYNKLVEENEVLKEIQQELQDELVEISHIQQEYKKIIENPSDTIQEAVDLLRVEQDLLEDYYNETETFLGRVREVIKDFGGMLRTYSRQILDDINAFLMGEDNNSTPLSDALKRALNIGDYKIASDLLPQVGDINMRYLVGREKTLVKKIGELQQKMQEIYNAKDEVAKRLEEASSVTSKRIERVTKKTPEQVKQDQTEKRKDTRDKERDILDEVGMDTTDFNTLMNKEGEITLDDIDTSPENIKELNNMKKNLNQMYLGERKNVDEVYRSTMLMPNNLKDMPLYKRWDRFVSSIKTMPKEVQNNLRVVFITSKNEQRWVGQRIIDRYFKDEMGENYFKEEETKTDLDKGGIISAMVIKDEGAYYYINEQGEKIGKVGSTLSKSQSNEIVAWQMPDTDLTFENSNTLRAYSEQDNLTEQLSEERVKYKLTREAIFNSNNANLPPISRFRVSRGSSTRRDGEYHEIDVIGNLIHETDIQGDTQYVFQTNRNTKFKGIPLAKGSIVFADENGLTQLTRTAPSEETVMSVYNALRYLSKRKKGDDYEGVREFIRSTISTSGTKSIDFDKNGESFVLNGEIFEMDNSLNNPDGLTARRLDILDGLAKTLTTVNVKELNSMKPFTEYVIDGKGTLVDTKVYPNYQSYLLDKNNPKLKAYTKEFVDQYLIMNEEDYNSVYSPPQQDRDVVMNSVVQALKNSGLFNQEGVQKFHIKTDENKTIESDSGVASKSGKNPKLNIKC